jgi:hypothetical protein
MDRMTTIGTNDPEFEVPDMRQTNGDVHAFLQTVFQKDPCPQCGAVQIAGRFTRCCNGYSEIIKDNLPQEVPMDLRREIERRTNEISPSFPRILNKDLRPVMQNANIQSPRAGGSTVFITGIPYARDSYQ